MIKRFCPLAVITVYTSDPMGRYVLICGNDALLILGSLLKQLIETRTQEDDGVWDVCSLLLGTANLLVWFSLLR